MFAFLEIPREAVRQWRTNAVGRWVWRGLSWRTVPATILITVAFYPVWPGIQWLAGLVGIVRASPLLYLLMPLGLIVNPYPPLSIWLTIRYHRRTFIDSVALQVVPLTPHERLWGTLLPIAAALVAMITVGPILRTLTYYPVSQPPADRLLFAIVILPTRLLYVAHLVPYYLLIGLRGLLARNARGPAIGPVVGSAILPLGIMIAANGLMTPCLNAFFYFGLQTWASQRAIAISSYGFYALSELFTAILLTLILVPLMCRLLLNTMRRAEAELFTPEAVERWETRDR